MVLGITGHRPSKLGGYDDSKNRSKAIKEALRMQFEDLQPEWILSGMALGVDQWAVEVALEMGIKVAALIPCAGQERMWPESAQKKYHMLLTKVNKVVQVSNKPYAPELMKARNQAIVNGCDFLLAVWDGTVGGTGSCVRAARASDRIGRVLHPLTLEVQSL